MKLRVMLLAFALAACGPASETTGPAGEDAAPDPFNLHIEIGRYGVMLGHVEELARERPRAAEPDIADPGDLARNLRETVWEYNLARSRLCARGLYSEAACGPIYAPIWLADAAAPSLEELQTRADAVGGEVMRLWNTVCEDARTREPDEQMRMYVCAIE